MHEQSETVQLPGGGWVNVYGRNTPKAGRRLPGTPVYASVEAAVADAKKQSDEHGEKSIAPPNALPLAVVDGRGQKPTPQQVELLKLFNMLRPDQRIDLRQQWQRHGYIPGEAIRRMLGIVSLRDTTESGLR